MSVFLFFCVCVCSYSMYAKIKINFYYSKKEKKTKFIIIIIIYCNSVHPLLNQLFRTLYILGQTENGTVRIAQTSIGTPTHNII